LHSKAHSELLTVGNLLGAGDASSLILFEVHMNLIIWLILGGIVGWLASLVMRRDAQQGIIMNVIVGIVGALIGGWVLSPSSALARLTKISSVSVRS
jgi:uncharacterized membrane protein YeaQ/YmgE (transglycosylase-associated protein family)